MKTPEATVKHLVSVMNRLDGMISYQSNTSNLDDARKRQYEAFVLEQSFDLSGFVVCEDQHGNKASVSDALANEYVGYENLVGLAEKIVRDDRTDMIAFVAINCQMIFSAVEKIALTEQLKNGVQELGSLDKAFRFMSSSEIELASFYQKNFK